MQETVVESPEWSLSDLGYVEEPRLVGCAKVAQTALADDAHDLNDEGVDVEELPRQRAGDNFFTGLEWSADGTTILCTTDDCKLETFVLPPDLLDSPADGAHHDLAVYRTYELPEPARATTIYPYYNLSAPETCLYLTSPRDLPIRLVSPFSKDLLATYPLVHPTTEAWIAPHSLLFSSEDPNTFFAGADGFVTIFDLQRPGSEPITKIWTGSSRKRKTGTAAMLASNGQDEQIRGINSAMAMTREGILAVGTFRGHVGLLDSSSASPVISRLPMPEEARYGITSIKFHPSPSQTQYLLVASRMSDAMHVFDIRNPHKPLSTLHGRHAETQQRLGIDITESGEVWAGGMDGITRIWRDLGMDEGDIYPWKELAHEQDERHSSAVSGVGVHPGGAGVYASCSGSRQFSHQAWSESTGGSGTEEDDDDMVATTDNVQGKDRSTLKVWQI